MHFAFSIDTEDDNGSDGNGDDSHRQQEEIAFFCSFFFFVVEKISSWRCVECDKNGNRTKFSVRMMCDDVPNNKENEHLIEKCYEEISVTCVLYGHRNYFPHSRAPALAFTASIAFPTSQFEQCVRVEDRIMCVCGKFFNRKRLIIPKVWKFARQRLRLHFSECIACIPAIRQKRNICSIRTTPLKTHIEDN